LILIAGADEVGLGSAAYYVYSAAVILDPERPIEGLKDSKKLLPKRRQLLSDEIKEKALAWSIATANLEEIETLNVRRAALLAMKRAIESLSVTPDAVLVDGNLVPDVSMPAQAVIKGDETIDCISAASIIAKVARDEAMMENHRLFPQYGFDAHKGYMTAAHQAALIEYGPCPIHRRTYAPIRKLLEEKGQTDEGLREEIKDEG